MGRIRRFLRKHFPYIQVSLLGILMLYTVLGGFMFVAIEAPAEIRRLTQQRSAFLGRKWRQTSRKFIKNKYFYKFSILSFNANLSSHSTFAFDQREARVDSIIQQIHDVNCTDVYNWQRSEACMTHLKSTLSVALINYEQDLNVKVPNPNKTTWTFDKVGRFEQFNVLLL
jgi:hypothetical protein